MSLCKMDVFSLMEDDGIVLKRGLKSKSRDTNAKLFAFDRKEKAN